ncbi:MAG: hypothetical protein DRP74_05120 [Candidatus Omnitrophota bacterium]|mgnify:CR=1 FL=1|nr:MAG: hypothetical protein DRP74_05120 [Candidatus Omnitrophota bacterium]
MAESRKPPYWLLLIFLIIAVLHNALYGYFQKEYICFVVALIVSILFFLLISYAIFFYIQTGKPKDLWKFAFLGLLGLLGFNYDLGRCFFAFFALFSLFVFVKKEPAEEGKEEKG